MTCSLSSNGLNKIIKNEKLKEQNIFLKLNKKIGIE